MQKSLKKIKNKFHPSKKRVKKFKKKKFKQLFSFAKKKSSLFLKHKMFKIKNVNFSKTLNLKIKSNNFFFTFKEKESNRTLQYASSSRYKIKITGKRLKYQIIRFLTFCYHESKIRLIPLEGLIIKLSSPRFLRAKIYRWCSKHFSKYRENKIRYKRNILYIIKSTVNYNGCRAKKRRRKKRRRKIFKKNAYR